ncbi:HlyD family secretion protein [Catalinimonas alkaloidigena]|uniref:HlyD family secretion protein n=1 Tax=Catalinimonas alkaloidigena TaxID=1075417 RepID=A0A1G9JGY1_9BACT|nr:efflux RND transporter periplasmic adaptor subunit [Catalinimonas alkaloidigena]SDL36542.1 HlyD family secretion protein [Catalinimonas alkaloidigena]
MNRFAIITIIIVLVVSMLGTGYFLYQKQAEPPVTYQTDSLFVTNIVKKTVATGSIVPRREIELKSQVPGVIATLFVEAGAQVKEGDPIAKIRIIPDVVQVENAQNRLKTAQINLKNAERELERNKTLFEQKVISEQEFRSFQLDYNLREQELEGAENNLELIKNGASKNSQNVSNIVRSTVTGMVLDVPVEEGSFVIESNSFNEGTTIASVADMNEMIFEGQVDESEVGKLKEGMDLVLKVGALETETFNAKLEYIAPKGIEEEGAIQFEIRAAVNLKEGTFLRAGYSANADIVLDKRDKVLAIKESNLQFDNGKPFVEVMTAPQQFEKRPVKVGLSDGINIEVVSGIDEATPVKKL